MSMSIRVHLKDRNYEIYQEDQSYRRLEEGVIFTPSISRSKESKINRDLCKRYHPSDRILPQVATFTCSDLWTCPKRILRPDRATHLKAFEIRRLSLSWPYAKNTERGSFEYGGLKCLSSHSCPSMIWKSQKGQPLVSICFRLKWSQHWENVPFQRSLSRESGLDCRWLP